MDRSREIKALEMRGAGGAERHDLRFGLDPFRDHAEPQGAAEMDDRMDDRRTLALAAHAVDEAAVDLQAIERELADVVEAGIAGAEIVERDAETHLAQAVQRIGRPIGIVEDRRFGNLDLDPVRLDAGALHAFEDMTDEIVPAELAR